MIRPSDTKPRYWRHQTNAGMARELGITVKQLRLLGGRDRIKAMSEEARALMVGLAKKGKK